MSEIKMTGPCKTISYAGKEIVADAEGVFLVPVQAVEALISHGFEIVKEEIESIAEEVKPRGRKKDVSQ